MGIRVDGGCCGISWVEMVFTSGCECYMRRKFPNYFISLHAGCSCLIVVLREGRLRDEIGRDVRFPRRDVLLLSTVSVVIRFACNGNGNGNGNGPGWLDLRMALPGAEDWTGRQLPVCAGNRNSSRKMQLEDGGYRIEKYPGTSSHEE